jgi:hypothetical protein
MIPKNSSLELIALVVVSALLGGLSVVVALLIGNLAQGRGVNWAALTCSESLLYYPVFAAALAATAVLWYVRRGDLQIFSYWDGVLWGVACFLATATIALIPNLSSARGSPYGLVGTMVFVYLGGGLFALPAVFTVAPLALWCWHRVVARLR